MNQGSTFPKAETREVVAKLRSALNELVAAFGKSETLPDSAPFLELESRAGDRKRQIKHIHQLSTVHSWHFNVGTRMKLAYMLDGYLRMLDGNNPIGIVALARCLLELRIAIHQLHRRLTDALAEPDLLTRGERFFREIVKARYATKDPRLRAQLVEAGVPDEQIGRPKLSPGIRLLTSEPGTEWIGEHYDMLCDYVHPNIASFRPSVSELPFGNRAASAWGVIVVPEDGTQVTYSYRSERALIDAVERTAERARDNTVAAIETIGMLPHSPFSATELEIETGDKTGFGK